MQKSGVISFLYGCYCVLLTRDKTPEQAGKISEKLALQIIDCKDQIAKNLSIDSFICGFQLAWQMANELNTYQEGRPVPTRAVGVDVLSASGESRKE